MEKFEGAGGGPREQRVAPNTRHVSAFLGENHAELATGTFDVVYSISVVEHVPTPNLAQFHEDQLRILRPGGLFCHAIDVYLADELPAHYVKRLDRYRDWVVNTSGVVPVGPILNMPLVFTCDLASNPDDVMYMWNRSAPALVELRQRAQGVSLMVAGRKAESQTDDALSGPA